MKYKTNPVTIGLTVLVTALVVGAGMFLWQDADLKKTNLPNTKEVAAQTLPTPKKLECSKDWTLYESEHISFCYKNSWGKPKMTDQTHKNGKGKLVEINFSNEQYRDVDEAPTTPQIWFETKDFAPAAADYTTVCFSCINFKNSESEIIKALGYTNKNATVQKATVDGKDALRIKTDYVEKMFDQGKINRLEYLVPNTFNEYNLQTVISYSKADELDMLMKNITFKN